MLKRRFHETWLPSYVWLVLSMAAYSAMAGYTIAATVITFAVGVLGAFALIKSGDKWSENAFTIGLLIFGIAVATFAIVMETMSVGHKITILVLLGYVLFGYSVLPFARRT